VIIHVLQRQKYYVSLHYTVTKMIKTIKSKPLRLLWEKDDSSKLPASQIKKIRIILEIIDNLEEVPDDLSFYKNLRPHLLGGDKKGFWSLDVTGNYRIIFRFENKDAFDLDYLDTH
jgi:proteic killer suppression protein